MCDLDVLLQFVLSSVEHARVNTVIGLDTFNRGVKGLRHPFVADASSSQNLEGEGGLRGLPHRLVYPRWVALNVYLVRHFQQPTYEHRPPLLLHQRAIVDAARPRLYSSSTCRTASRAGLECETDWLGFDRRFDLLNPFIFF